MIHKNKIHFYRTRASQLLQITEFIPLSIVMDTSFKLRIRIEPFFQKKDFTKSTRGACEVSFQAHELYETLPR